MKKSKEEEYRAELSHMLADARFRSEHISAIEDSEVEALCDRVGYGAVMDAASRLWLKKEFGGGAFIIGGAYDVIASLVDEPFLRNTKKCTHQHKLVNQGGRSNVLLCKQE